MQLKKTALVSGCSSGIGFAITIFLLEKGYLVTGLSRSLNPTLSKYPNFKWLEIDLSDLKNLELFCKKELLNHPYDLVVLSAGKGLFGKIENLSFQDLNTTITLNYLSTAYLIKGLLPSLKKRQSGHIFVIGSEAALKGRREGSSYCASKFALRGFIQAIQDECPKHPKITLIHPGLVRTPFFNHLHFKPSNNCDAALSPEDIVHLINSTLQSNTLHHKEYEIQPKQPKIVKK